MTRSTGDSGLILVASPPSFCIALAHGGEIDHGGHAGEVLHQHPRRTIGDLAGRISAPSAIAAIGATVLVDRDRAPVFVAWQHGFSNRTFMELGRVEKVAEPLFFGGLSVAENSHRTASRPSRSCRVFRSSIRQALLVSRCSRDGPSPRARRTRGWKPGPEAGGDALGREHRR